MLLLWRRPVPRASSTLQRWGALVGVAAGLFLGGFSAPAALAAPPALNAPDGTTQAWVDIEGAAPQEAAQAVSAAPAGGAWVDATPTATPFGLTAIFDATPGAFDLRFRISEPATADIAVTFADANGVILEEELLRSVALSPKQADSDGWVPWSTLEEGSGEANGQTPASGSGAEGRDPLSNTGQPESVNAAAIAIALLALGGASAFFALARKSRKMGASE